MELSELCRGRTGVADLGLFSIHCARKGLSGRIEATGGRKQCSLIHSNPRKAWGLFGWPAYAKELC